MKKLLLCNLRMGDDTKKTVYASDDKHIPVSETPVIYPVMAFLEKILKSDEEIKAILLAKDDGTNRYKGHVDRCKEELDQVAAKTGARFITEVISTPFKEDAKTHGDLMLQIVDKLDENSEIILDMTYGPKDQAFIEFSALNFAQRYLNCEIGEILYGHTVFVDGKPTNPHICEMGSLFYLNSLISDVRSNDPAKAKEMLKVLLQV